MARDKYEDDSFITSRRIILVITGILLFIGAVIVPSELLVRVKPDEIVVKQGMDGKTEVWTQPGLYWQNFGTLITFKKSSQYWFSAKTDEGDSKDQSIKVRFNDGGHGNISGSISYDLPLDPIQMMKIYSTFGTQEGVEKRLVAQAVGKAVYMTGTLMSSKESSGEHRADLINDIADQITRGVYVTETVEQQVPDILAGEEDTVVVVDVPDLDDQGKPKLDKNGNPIIKKEAKTVKKPRMKTVTIVRPKVNDKGIVEVQEASTVTAFGIRTYNLAINSIAYDQQVEEQIKQQQQAIMAVQTAMANAKKADQDRLTVEKQGEANAAKAKWEQEVKKAQAVTEAQQKKEVAQLELDTAELTKQAAIKRAEGDAEARKLVMAADGALEKKLAAYVEVQKAYAEVLGKQPLVPQIMMGGGSSGSQGANIMDLFQAKTARDLALDLGVKK